ncbi:hypothetical protein PAERUG_P45_London_17_VIM_2_12_12_00882 [Pseudomonas aeruginosa]|nr:hypothetical protein PAERUG_P45_London_17_VIM_2_12_12_00882 [Pseudomonas aeruginosa]
MIPVAPLPLIVPLIYLSSFVAGIWLLVWLSLLAFSPRARRWPSRGLLMLLLLIPLGLRAWLEIGLWQYERERAREEAAHSAVLERPTRLGGIEMPAGTRLKLELKHQPESFREAEFPTPVTIRGVATRHLQRWLQSEQDNPQDPWKTTGVHPTSLRLRGEGVAEIEGWRCDASQEIAFASERDGRPAAFEGCSLATGNRADDIDFPAGARLFASDGMVYTDGYRDAERWRVMPETGQRVSVHRAERRRPGLRPRPPPVRPRRYGPRRGLATGRLALPGRHRGQPFTPRRLARATSARLAVQSYPRSRFACLRRAPGTRRLAVADAGRPGT